MKKKFGMGWVPSAPDHRDHYFSVAKKQKRKALPPMYDMRPQCPDIYNQGALGSCTAHATAAALHFTQLEEKKEDFVPGRLFIYYNTRALQGTINYDSGGSLRMAIKSVAKNGYCHEALCPYIVDNFKKQPVRRAYADAETRKLSSLYYARVNQDLDELKIALADNNPVIFGFSVYESFMSENVEKTGIVPMPSRREKMEGGHAVCLVGYDDSDSWFIVRNSWGEKWGDEGYFFMPYDYVLNENLANDFWVVREVP
jgi:C1A family cysteine protease